MDPVIGHIALNKIDPYGCITYRVFIDEKKRINSSNINRNLESTVFISTKNNEFHTDFKSNIIKLPKWNCSKDNTMLDLVHFFTNFNYMNPKDVRPTLMSYNNKNFIDNFKVIQKQL